MWVAQNGLRGTLPEEIRGLPLLVEFGAADNNMKGTIPSGITALTELVDIFLFESGVSGTLPQEMNNLSKLTHLALQNNDLTGSIPSSLYSLTSLENLFLSDNRLSGTLLTFVGNLVSLKQLWLSANRFSGIIPSDVSRMTSLGTFRLSFVLTCCIHLFCVLYLAFIIILSSYKVNIFLEDNDFSGGMENFCTGSIDFVIFESDCYTDGFQVLEPEVECSCCSECCGQGGSDDCVPNDGTFSQSP